MPPPPSRKLGKLPQEDIHTKLATAAKSLSHIHWVIKRLCLWISQNQRLWFSINYICDNNSIRKNPAKIQTANLIPQFSREIFNFIVIPVYTVSLWISPETQPGEARDLFLPHGCPKRTFILCPSLNHRLHVFKNNSGFYRLPLLQSRGGFSSG